MLGELNERYDILSVMADREFFNTDDLKTFKKYSRFFLTPATRYQSVKEKEDYMAVKNENIVDHRMVQDFVLSVLRFTNRGKKG